MLQIKSKYKICKRLGAGVFEQCQTQKFSLSEARARKGRGRRRGPRNMSDYGKQLIEKQKVRYTYGLSEKQFRKYVNAAMETAEPTASLYRFLESRLDNAAYRLNLASTRRAARQLVSHGHLQVNGKRMTVPSHQLQVGDAVSVRASSQNSPLFAHFKTGDVSGVTPEWLSMDPKQLTGSVTGEPSYTGEETFLDFAAVLEFYSR